MMQEELMQGTVNSPYLKQEILKVLNYFHVFRHPLDVHEIRKFISVEVCINKLSEMLQILVREGTVYQSHSLYSLENSGQIFLKRIVGSELAREKIKEARKSAAIISRFPFVHAICISGSLSKGYADENSDIDFFIITNERRLWICRTILHVFKKFTFLINKQHSFCMNYFIDASRLKLEEQNIFTATELATLIPVYNACGYKKLMIENEALVNRSFPNYNVEDTDTSLTKSDIGGIKLAAEWILNRLSPIRVNNFFMWLTDIKWRRKWAKKNYPMEDYDLAMKTRWYVSKQHPLNYQKKVLKHQEVPGCNIAIDI